MGSDPNAFVTLPPEILDEILDCIPADREGQTTLISCALVATSWTEPSQRHLLSSVSIRKRNYQQWINSVVLSGSKARLLGYVRSLWIGYNGDISIKFRSLLQDHGEYLSALHNLHSLTFTNTRVERIPQDQFNTCFSAFRGTLTYLSLEVFATSFSAFVTLVDYFPNIRSLQLRLFVVVPDEGSVPSLSRPLRGKLRIHSVQANLLEFFDHFAKLDLEYEELVVGSPSTYVDPRFLESALRMSTNTVKSLRITCGLPLDANAAIPNFRQLQELELNLFRPSSVHEVLLSSISSTDLRKIIFRSRYMDDGDIFALEVEDWTLIDEQLYRLVDRLRTTGYHHTLEVELRLTHAGEFPVKHGFTKLLPVFREKGVVIITDAAHEGRVLYSSNHNR